MGSSFVLIGVFPDKKYKKFGNPFFYGLLMVSHIALGLFFVLTITCILRLATLFNAGAARRSSI